jgi:hypothetical protein
MMAPTPLFLVSSAKEATPVADTNSIVSVALTPLIITPNGSPAARTTTRARPASSGDHRTCLPNPSGASPTTTWAEFGAAAGALASRAATVWLAGSGRLGPNSASLCCKYALGGAARLPCFAIVARTAEAGVCVATWCPSKGLFLNKAQIPSTSCELGHAEGVCCASLQPSEYGEAGACMWLGTVLPQGLSASFAVTPARAQADRRSTGPSR